MRQPKIFPSERRAAAVPPERALLVVDGACAVCSWGARLIARRDKGDVFRIATAQSKLGRQLLARHGLDPDDPSSWLLLENGEARFGADAALSVGRRLSGVWPLLARLASLTPRSWREAGYAWLARNRIRLFGRADLCAAPSDELRRRLVLDVASDDA